MNRSARCVGVSHRPLVRHCGDGSTSATARARFFCYCWPPPGQSSHGLTDGPALRAAMAALSLERTYCESFVSRSFVASVAMHRDCKTCARINACTAAGLVSGDARAASMSRLN
jgi:hypothetical protein